ncbi:hypothetical protein Cni_G04705 [Canna indica]|uniref:J domain-containing protein n=1 Tax=Canna indica TaxID=4628 RepID=A0AAQ3JVA2_9LILI|nr:hypothetical protein Cni_G04705 [Canna indica]
MGGVARCSISAHAYLCSGAATRSGTSPPPTPPWLSRPPNGSSIHYRHCSRSWRLSCREAKSDSCSSGGAGRDEIEDWVSSPSASPYQVLGVDPSCCSPDQLKAAFRARVKEFHPDVCKDMKDADAIIKRVIRAYEDMVMTTKSILLLDSAQGDAYIMSHLLNAKCWRIYLRGLTDKQAKLEQHKSWLIKVLEQAHLIFMNKQTE